MRRRERGGGATRRLAYARKLTSLSPLSLTIAHSLTRRRRKKEWTDQAKRRLREYKKKQSGGPREEEEGREEREERERRVGEVVERMRGIRMRVKGKERKVGGLLPLLERYC